MFTKSAAFYDALYHWKDYAAESRRVRELIQQYQQTGDATLLDVACGTGQHLAHLREQYQVEGLDLDPQLLQIARERLPGVPLHTGDMRDFDLGKQFAAITCLFSSIGYVKTVEAMRQTVANFTRHLQPGGVLIVEPWFKPGDMQPDTVHALFIDQPELKISRINITRIEGRLSWFEFHYLVGTPESVEHFTERHELGLFTREEYWAAFSDAGLEVQHDEEGLMGRGVYIGVKPLN